MLAAAAGRYVRGSASGCDGGSQGCGGEGPRAADAADESADRRVEGASGKDFRVAIFFGYADLAERAVRSSWCDDSDA